MSPPPDFESGASTNSATPAQAVIIAKNACETMALEKLFELFYEATSLKFLLLETIRLSRAIVMISFMQEGDGFLLQITPNCSTCGN